MRQKITGIFLTFALNYASIAPVIATTPGLQGTAWKLSSWTAGNLVKDADITLAFDKTNLSGSAGCNRYNTGYQVKDGTINVEKTIVTTKKACAEDRMTQEARFLQSLAEIEQYTLTSRGELQLFYRTNEGMGIMTFSPAVTRSERVIFVNSQRRPCAGNPAQSCLQIRDKPEDAWRVSPIGIEGFDHKPGFIYRLKIAVERSAATPNNKNTEKWTLIEVMSQTPDRTAAEPKEAPRGWLDRPLTNWNTSTAIPKAPVKSVIDNQCREQVRQGITPADAAIVKAGWILFGPVQIYGKTSVISAMSGVDGMCRPMGYQEFVFVDGKFAGTLSPRPMDSRTDGASQRVILQNNERIIAVFNRFKDTDPLCCPSQLSRVVYQIEKRKNNSFVVPKEVTTEAIRN